ncbi:hypothetical protein E2C01_064333 [Portunus trituberculatus]|uniref:Uncharacterized protein n=1 Tax=Portunus trituberculatus TaxID=210409 RepID=A0A5B7HNH5_PORTR|nr:hypothetical protein [Portunus trituberculatus]
MRLHDSDTSFHDNDASFHDNDSSFHNDDSTPFFTIPMRFHDNDKSLDHNDSLPQHSSDYEANDDATLPPLTRVAMSNDSSHTTPQPVMK